MSETNLKKIVELYKSDARVHRLIPDTTKEVTQLVGVKGAQYAFLVAGLALHSKKNQLVVMEEKESAAYLMNTLTTILPGHEILFLPDSFKRPQLYEELNKTNVLQRTESVNKLSNTAKYHIIVTYPEALFEQVVAPQYLEETTIKVRKDESLDVSTTIDILVEYGFKREEYVYQPGQFSIRGGIVDIFSFGNELPYRIELFDDEVESIRVFDPLTQLSKRKVESLNIIPNLNTQFRKEHKTSIFQILGEDSMVWMHDLQFVTDKLMECFDKVQTYSDQFRSIEDQDELRMFFDDRSFIRPDEIMDDLLNLKKIFWRPNTYSQFGTGKTVSFEAKPQPSFNKNFKLLIEDLEKLKTENIQPFLFTENPRQVERFQNIFNDLNANVAFEPIIHGIHEGFIDYDLKIACYTDHQVFNRFYQYKLRKGYSKDQAMSLKMLKGLESGDFVTHIDHGVGRYSGLEKIEVNGQHQESVRIIYKNNDILYVSINALHKITKYAGKEGTAPKLSKLGSDAWQTVKNRTKKKVKDIAKDLIKLYAKRKAAQGFAFPEDGYLQNELEASFLYEDTPDQVQATIDVKTDMQSPNPMDRLVCGDVGFGKTEIAIRAAFKAIVGGKQVAVLVPTTILALQHYKTFNERLAHFGVKVDFINRFKSAKQKREIFESLKEGKIDLVIGTHGLLNKNVGFKDLGLLVIDEEQKFGVAAKEKLRSLKTNVDTLILTATPIPRTLQFSLMAARDMSILRTAPPNRQPIHTEIRIFHEKLIRDAIYYETNRGGQVFFVHNRVKSIPDVTTLIKRICPDLEIRMAHGQMDVAQLEKSLVDFIDKKYDVLVSTNIIETGLDIPNANTIIINNAHQFGLSDLHQLRGRVGRSNQKAFCYLFCPPLSSITAESRKRLLTIEEFSDLGSGFDVAMRDLDIRGAGNLLGGEQSGFISDIGYDAYQKILEEAIQELKDSDFKDLFAHEKKKDKNYVRSVEIDTDVEMLIPSEYVSNVQERLRLYTQLDLIDDEEKLNEFATNLEDRFGSTPVCVQQLYLGLRMRWLCRKMGFERLLYKNQSLRLIFVENAQSPFYDTKYFKDFIQFIAMNSEKLGASIKQTPKYLMLIIKPIQNMDAVYDKLVELSVGAKV